MLGEYTEQTPQKELPAVLNCTRTAVHGLHIKLGEGDLVHSELIPHPET